MNFEKLFGYFSQADFLSFAIVIPAAIFAGFMTWWAPLPHRTSTYSTYLFEAVTIEAAAVLIASTFSSRLYELVGDSKIFISIVSLATLMYAIRDVLGRARQPSRTPVIGHDNKLDRMSDV